MGVLRGVLLTALLATCDARPVQHEIQETAQGRSLSRTGKRSGSGNDGGAQTTSDGAAVDAGATSKEGISTTLARKNCCWTMNAETKRWQYYQRPAGQDCILPYKENECPGARVYPPPPPLILQPQPVAVADPALPSQTQESSPVTPAQDLPSISAPVPSATSMAALPISSSERKDRGGNAGESSSAAALVASTPPSASPVAIGAVPSKLSTAAPPPAPKGSKAKSKDKTSGGSGISTVLFLAASAAAAYVFRDKLRTAVAEYFPEGGAAGGAAKKPVFGGQGEGYNRVAKREDDASSQNSNSCGLAETCEEVDAIAEEWAARLQAQREGRAYEGPADGAGAACSGAMVCAGAMPMGMGCGAGAVPNFASPPKQEESKAPEPAAGGFDGFDGFEEEVEEEFDERTGWATRSGAPPETPAWAPPSQQQPPPQPQQPNFGLTSSQLDIDYGQLGNLGGQAEAELDWGILAETPTAGRKTAGAQAAASGHPKEEDTFGAEEEEDDDEFTVFDGFGKDNRPTKGGGPALSWDAESKKWEQHNARRLGGGGGGGGGGKGSPWDLRTASFRSPESISRFRQRAEKVFDDAIGNSIFKSPTMSKFKKQTDELFSGMSSTISSFLPVSATNIFKENPLKSLWSFFG